MSGCTSSDSNGRGRVRRFKRANTIERARADVVRAGVVRAIRKTPVYEAWSDLGEKLFGYDDEIARQAALAAPVHSMILWRRIEKILRAVPPQLRSTRLAEFEAQRRVHAQRGGNRKPAQAGGARWMRLWQTE